MEVHREIKSDGRRKEIQAQQAANEWQAATSRGAQVADRRRTTERGGERKIDS